MTQLFDREKNTISKYNKTKTVDEISIELHEFYRGKMNTLPKCPIDHLDDFSIWYSPGVAAPCRAIVDNPEKVYDLTNKGNTVAIVSNGSRVLGLGNIGPEAGLPVMEGKALLFKFLGGVDAYPIMLATNDANKIVDTVLQIQPTFGGINLEDISQPECFYILEELQKKAHIPVWHDDQQGTATVTLAALINSLKIVEKKKEDIRITFIGAGAAGIACSRLIFSWGVDPTRSIFVDERGILGTHRKDFQKNSLVWDLCQKTNHKGRKGNIPEALKGADVIIAFSKPGPGIILPEWIKFMADNPIIFACANPVPEIWPSEAIEAGARIVATGRSDFPNQVNNALSFPAIFRGVLDTQAQEITDQMCFAAAQTLSESIGSTLDEKNILPKLNDYHIYPLQAAAVGVKAQEQGVARLNFTYEELLKRAEDAILLAHRSTKKLIESNCIGRPN